MPKKDAEVVVCDGCATERADIAEPNDAGLRYCDACAERREGDPQIVVQGRALTVSELKTQAEDDEDLAAALEGDTVKDQIKANKR